MLILVKKEVKHQLGATGEACSTALPLVESIGCQWKISPSAPYRPWEQEGASSHSVPVLSLPSLLCPFFVSSLTLCSAPVTWETVLLHGRLLALAVMSQLVLRLGIFVLFTCCTGLCVFSLFVFCLFLVSLCSVRLFSVFSCFFLLCLFNKAC